MATKLKPTPRPWRINKVWGTIEGPEGQEICAIHAADVSGRREPRETAQANAWLIVHSHDMLAMLEELVRSNYGQPKAVRVPALDPARALIAKITGKQL